MIDSNAFMAASKGISAGGAIGGAIGGVLHAMAARKQAKHAAKLVERQAEIRARAMEQEALDFLVLADYTAAQSLLDAQDVERIARFRGNVTREAGRRRRGDIRAQAGASGTVVDDTSTIMQLADDVYQTELAALQEQYQGERAGGQLRTEADQMRYKARLGLSNARRGQQALLQSARAQGAGIKREANQMFTQTLLNSFLGPQTLQGILPLLGSPPRLTPSQPQAAGGVFGNPFQPLDAAVAPAPDPLRLPGRNPLFDPLPTPGREPIFPNMGPYE